MFGRIAVKGLLAALATLWAIAGTATVASAQDWDRWGGPRRMPPAPQTSEPYDDRYEEPDEERYEPRAERRYDDTRSKDWRYGDDQEAIERDNAERSYRNQYGRRRFDERRQYRDPFADGNQENRRDTAREPAPEDQSKPEGDDGGPQPYIQATAPPRVVFSGGNMPGTIVIDTSGRRLYYVLGPTSAYAYPIGVGREGFSWTGLEKISRVADWPDWYPPAEMRKRKPELPERMLGGVRNPLGAKAIYLGNTLYRIHGTNNPKSIGKAESSGCFRMLNEHVLHLASLVQIGTQVTVVRSLGANKVVAKTAPRPRVTDQRVRPPRWRERGEYYPGDYR